MRDAVKSCQGMLGGQVTWNVPARKSPKKCPSDDKNIERLDTLAASQVGRVEIVFWRQVLAVGRDLACPLVRGGQWQQQQPELVQHVPVCSRKAGNVNCQRGAKKRDDTHYDSIRSRTKGATHGVSTAK